MMGLTRVLPFSLHHACMQGFFDIDAIAVQAQKSLELTNWVPRFTNDNFHLNLEAEIYSTMVVNNIILGLSVL